MIQHAHTPALDAAAAQMADRRLAARSSPCRELAALLVVARTPAQSLRQGRLVQVQRQHQRQRPCRASAALDTATADTGRQAAAAETQLFDWQRHWYPVAVVDDLDVRRPHALLLLGKRLVLWRDGGGEWRCFKDRCPHRLAALSEGRIEPSDGTLQCSYHGFRFGSDGACVRIPQAASPKAEAAAMANRQSCAIAYPTQVRCGMVWVWPASGPGEAAAAAATEPLTDALPGEADGHNGAGSGSGSGGGAVQLLKPFMRDLPYDFETLLENVADPSHVPFSHHGVQGNREKVTWGASAMTQAEPAAPLELACNVHMAPGRSSRLSYTPPHRLQYQFPIPKKDGGEPSLLLFTVWAIPTSPGHSRLLSTQRVSSASWLFKLAALKPAWVDHVFNRNAVLDGDAVFLHLQEKQLGEEALQHGKEWNKQYYLPTSADTMLSAIRKWLESGGGGGPYGPAPAKYALFPPPEDDRSKLLDRYHTHTKHCASCRKALATVTVMRAVAAVAAVLFFATAMVGLLVGIPFPTQSTAVNALASFAVLGMLGVAAAFFHRLRRRFFFVDYEHWER